MMMSALPVNRTGNQGTIPHWDAAYCQFNKAEQPCLQKWDAVNSPDCLEMYSQVNPITYNWWLKLVDSSIVLHNRRGLQYYLYYSLSLLSSSVSVLEMVNIADMREN